MLHNNYISVHLNTFKMCYTKLHASLSYNLYFTMLHTIIYKCILHYNIAHNYIPIRLTLNYCTHYIYQCFFLINIAQKHSSMFLLSSRTHCKCLFCGVKSVTLYHIQSCVHCMCSVFQEDVSITFTYVQRKCLVLYGN